MWLTIPLTECAPTITHYLWHCRRTYWSLCYQRTICTYFPREKRLYSPNQAPYLFQTVWRRIESHLYLLTKGECEHAWVHSLNPVTHTRLITYLHWPLVCRNWNLRSRIVLYWRLLIVASMSGHSINHWNLSPQSLDKRSWNDCC